MAEELQALLEKIQKDGVEKAQTDANAITQAAKKKAAALVADAEQKAKELLEKAETDAVQFEDRARSSLLQAARDLVITVGHGVTDMLEKLLGERISGELQGDALVTVIAAAVNAYVTGGTAAADLSIELSEANRAGLEAALNDALKQVLADGATIESDGSVVSGFRVTMQDGKLNNDFSAAAITEALAGLLRPALAEIVRESAAQKMDAAG